jgi:hypothetical protein
MMATSNNNRSALRRGFDLAVDLAEVMGFANAPAGVMI